MNTVLETIKERRSVRQFTEAKVDEAQLEAILEAGLFAPSAHNQQPWHFTLITNAELLRDMNHLAKETAKTSNIEFLQKIGNNPDFHVFYKAPALIVVSGDDGAMNPKADTAAAAQNMLLAAESLGLGACWIGMLRLCVGQGGERFVKAFELPEGYSPYFAIAIGHKAHTGQHAPSRKPNKVNYIR